MKIALFNGLTCHYEMFGYIIYFCKTNKYELTIFYDSDTHKWIEFYNKAFNNYTIEYKKCIFFEMLKDDYDIIFLSTDDDPKFNNNWIDQSKNIICIDHHYTIRRPNIDLFYHIATRPFIENYRKWALPCYSLINVSSKIELMDKTPNDVNVLILGNMEYNFKTINRLSSNSNIVLYIISRRVNNSILNYISKNITVKLYSNVTTIELFNLIYKCKYIFVDSTTNNDHIGGKSMSASIPIAFSTLNQLIISTKNNSLYKFKSAITFNLDDDKEIVINNKIEHDILEKIYNEREDLINNFSTIVNNIISYKQL